MLNLFRLHLLLTMVIAPALLAGDAVSPEPWQAQKAIEELRWPLNEHTRYGMPRPIEPWLEPPAKEIAGQIHTQDTEARWESAYRTLEAMAIDPQTRPKAIGIYRELAGNLTDEEIAHELPPEGPREVQSRLVPPIEKPALAIPLRYPPRHLIRFRAYEQAMLYLLTGEREPFDQAKRILLRLAEVVPQWPVYFREDGHLPSRPQSDHDPAYFERTRSGGIWGIWHPMELGVDLPLLRAYDILKPALSDHDRRTIEDRFFIHHKLLMERYCAQLPYGKYPRYHNMLGNHLPPLIRFGWVLERPGYIHEAVTHWRHLLEYSFSPDGLFREVTPSYHRQIAGRSLSVAGMLAGYSDPAGYRHPGSGIRFDRLDLETEAAPIFARMRKALNVAAMPDGNYAALNDSAPDAQRIPDFTGVKADTPALLGVSALARLGHREMSLFLKFGGMRSHDHYDALGILWFAGGREVFSETGYRPLPGSGTTREWIASTAAHYTVAVDEKLHLQNRGSIVIPERPPHTSYNSYPPEKPGTYEGKALAEASLPGAAEFANQGRLLLWDGTRPEVQAMEAEQPLAYPRLTSLFRRTLILVPLGKGRGYLVDIFRIKGGRTHDYFLRGGLDDPYTLDVNLPLQPDARTLYKELRIQASSAVDQPFKAVVRYPDGWRTVSHFLGAFGSEPAALSFLKGEAPAIRRKGNAPYSLLRRSSSDPMETCFVWVHETGTGREVLQNLSVRHEGQDVMVSVEREGGRDLFLSGVSHQSAFNVEGWEFQGRLAVIMPTRAVVFSGSPLTKEGTEIVAGTNILSGSILETTQRDSGDAIDSLLVDTTGEGGSIRLAHIDFGKVIRFSIPVLGAEREGEYLRVRLAHPPGFKVEERHSVMTHFPGWRIFSPATVRLEGPATEKNLE